MADDYDHDGDGEFGEEDEEERTQGRAWEATREHIAFVVDVSPNMFSETIPVEGKPSSTFSLIMATIVDFMKKRIISGGRDEFAVIFYNSEKANNTLRHPNVHVYVPRDQPDATTIQKLEAIGNSKATKFMSEVGHLKVVPGDAESRVAAASALRNALWVTMEVLRAGASKNARHRIILFSNTENPVEGLDASYREIILQRAQPLKEMGATLRFFPLVSCKRAFNQQLFWNQLLQELRDPDDEAADEAAGGVASQLTTTGTNTQTQGGGRASGGAGTAGTAASAIGAAAAAATGQQVGSDEDVLRRLQLLALHMRRALQPRRATTTLRWSITDQCAISCQVFDLLVEAKKPFTVRLRASDNALLQVDTALVAEDTAALLTKLQHKQFLPQDKVAGRFPQRVVMSNQELDRKVRGYGQPGLRLLGFKPRSALQDYHNLDHSSFVRPTDRDVKGSITLFKALLQGMAKRDCIALCAYTRTRRSETRLVALLPQLEELDDEGYQVWAEGMHMIRLPFKDDMRAPEVDPKQVGDNLVQAAPEQVEAARQLMEALRFEHFGLGSVPNPALERHFEVLEALAMGDEPPALEDFVDGTQPPDGEEKVDDVAREALTRFKDACRLGVAEDGDSGGGAGTKRKAAAAASDISDLKTSEAYAKLDQQVNWAVAVKEGTLSKLTIPYLKVYLKYHNQPLSGNKAELVERITKHATGSDL